LSGKDLGARADAGFSRSDVAVCAIEFDVL
jgi:hypothetical protein